MTFESLHEQKVFRDPLYGYIRVDNPVIWELIQTKEFQRLRRIHQLGGTHMVYHTAEHSRFSHSLGTYETARKIITQVEDLNKILTEEEKLITLCSALLHDLGHGPFSHAFEHVFNTEHEEFTIKIILQDTEVNKVLRKVSDEFPTKIAQVIGKVYPNKIIVNLISSQLDADRLDYLQRDAYFTGAPYGEIDLERLIRSMLVKENKIVFKKSSIHAIEDYLMSRYHMYWQVYFHPVGRSHELILTNIFKRYRYLVEEGKDFNFEYSLLEKIIERDNIDLHEYIHLDESNILVIIQHFQHEKDDILADLSYRFFNRKLFKYIDCDNIDQRNDMLIKLSKLFTEAGIDPEYYLYTDQQTKSPYDYYGLGSKNESIKVWENDKAVEISELSQVVKGILHVKAKIDYKIYFPLDKVKEIKDEELRDRILSTLKI